MTYMDIIDSAIELNNRKLDHPKCSVHLKLGSGIISPHAVKKIELITCSDQLKKSEDHVSAAFIYITRQCKDINRRISKLSLALTVQSRAAEKTWPLPPSSRPCLVFPGRAEQRRQAEAEQK